MKKRIITEEIIKEEIELIEGKIVKVITYLQSLYAEYTAKGYIDLCIYFNYSDRYDCEFAISGSRKETDKEFEKRKRAVEVVKEKKKQAKIREKEKKAQAKQTEWEEFVNKAKKFGIPESTIGTWKCQ